MRERSVREWLPWAGFLLAVSFLTVYYFTHLSVLPYYDADETSLSSLAYRYAVFGDWTYPVFLSQSYGADELRVYPPLLSLSLRAAFASLPGVDPLDGRVFSAVAVLASVGLCGLLVWLAASRRWWALPLGMLLVGLHPSTLQAARSVRFEQEIVLSGLVALTCLVFAWHRKRAPLLLALTGVFAALASVSHPYGTVYGVVLGLAILLRAWQQRHAWRLALAEVLAFAAGAVIPVSVTLWWMLEKGGDLVAFQSAAATLYEIHTNRIQTALLGFQPDWLSGLVPHRISAGLEEFRRYGFYLRDAPVSTLIGPFQMSTWPLFFIGAGGLALLWARGLRVPPSLWLPILVTVGLTLFMLGYPPNANYYQYVGVHVSLAAALILVLAVAAAQRWLKALSLALLAAWGGLLLGFTGNMFPHVLAAEEMQRLGFPERARRFAALAETVGVGGGTARYCDYVVWLGCGEPLHSVMEVSPLGLIDPPPGLDAVMLDANFANGIAKGYPSMTDPQLDPSERLQRLARLTSAAPLAGVYLETDSTGRPDFADLIYSNAAVRPGHIVVALSRGLEPMELLIDAGSMEPSLTAPAELSWDLSQPGWYLLLAPPEMTSGNLRLSGERLVHAMPSENLARFEAVHTAAAVRYYDPGTLRVSGDPASVLGDVRLLRLAPLAHEAAR